jgi:hypothetical protein
MGEGEGFTVLMQEIWRRHSRKTRFGNMPKQMDTHEERHLECIIVFPWDLSKIEQYQLFLDCCDLGWLRTVIREPGRAA